MLSWEITEIEVLELLKQKTHFLHLTNVNLILNYCHIFIFVACWCRGVLGVLFKKEKKKKKVLLASKWKSHKIELPWFLLNFKNGLGGQILL